MGANTSFAFVTKVKNAANHITYTQYDYYLGRPVDVEDANGVVSSGYSVGDSLDRPTKVIRAVNTSAQNQTLFTYDDTAKTITTTSDHTSFNDLYPLKNQLVYDSLGRTIETRQYEGGGNYIVTQQQYDTLGRAYKTSNPFRPWQGETAVWTTTAFDSLGRVTTVTTPDNAAVTTSYSGNTAQFWLMVDNNSGTDVVATIDVVTGFGSNTLTQRQIRRNEFVAANQWQVFTLEFDNLCFGLVESRVWWSGTVNMKFSQVTITATNTSAVDIEWLVTDQLGTPRMAINSSTEPPLNSSGLVNRPCVDE